jgi:hypothetical protein
MAAGVAGLGGMHGPEPLNARSGLDDDLRGDLRLNRGVELRCLGGTQ